MNASSLVYPMFAMVVLTALTLRVLFRRRVAAVQAELVTIKYFRTFQGEVEPEITAQASRHFANLFEAPTLFYAACITAMVTGQTGILMVVLAWAYVAARLAHSYIHLGGNRVRHRVRAYFASWLVLGAMWITLAVGTAMRG